MKKVFIVALGLSTFANAQSENCQQITGGNFSASAAMIHGAYCENESAAVLNEERAVPSLVLENSQIEKHPMLLTGILSHDLFASDTSMKSKDSATVHETRSALKSGFFSFVVPGAGQAYNREYLKAVGFLALEAAGWTVNAIWNKKGNNETNAFHVYADGTAANHYQDGHYNVYRYAQWIVNNYQQLEQVNGTSSQGITTISQYINPQINNPNHNLIIPNQYDQTKAPWFQVNWDALNAVENAMSGTSNENSFSHWLFPYGDVEYYKCIAKYPQFRPGWSDENLSFLTYDQLRSLTPESNYYENMRGTATRFYNVALVAAGVIITNHFASAIESALWAHGHNKSFEANIGVSPLPQGVGYQSELQLAVRF